MIEYLIVDGLVVFDLILTAKGDVQIQEVKPKVK